MDDHDITAESAAPTNSSSEDPLASSAATIGDQNPPPTVSAKRPSTGTSDDVGAENKGEAIGKSVEKCLLEWDITKVMTITVDNASSNDVGVQYLRRRWNSTYLMLKYAMVYRIAFDLLENSDGDKFLAELTKLSGVPTDNDWDRVASLFPFLKIFYDATLRLFGSLRKMHYVKWAINDQYDSVKVAKLHDMVMNILTSLYERYASLQSQNVPNVSENIDLSSRDLETCNDWHDVADYEFERDIGGQKVFDKKK
uniref:Transposase n=1 Tax=Chenopodium quinoa TaxID=63459 RepID=A0A803MCJ2_CHEQI